MMKKYQADIPNCDATPERFFHNRRSFIQKLSVGLTTASTLSCTSSAAGQPDILSEPIHRPGIFPPERNMLYPLPRHAGSDLTPRQTAATHNNFYEFLPGRGGAVWKLVDDFKVDPWKIEVTGACQNPFTLDLDGLFKFPHEERNYHFRCVERWAMNIPWSGFPLRKIIDLANPKPEAQFIRFVTAYLPVQMPGIPRAPYYPWPYNEALRMDEAMHDLTMVVTGCYGRPLLKQHGAPVRIVVPWKYGYKSPKSVVKIEFVREQPKTFWQIQPAEYGFLSNVNPNIPHPRWSQKRSYWLGSHSWFKTPIFNGYDRYVAELYPNEPRTPRRPLRKGQRAR